MIMKILLMGGVGNRLFQISYGLSASQQKSIVLITLPRYIEEFASLFGWAYHQEWINIKDLCLKLNLNNRITFLDNRVFSDSSDIKFYYIFCFIERCKKL